MVSWTRPGTLRSRLTFWYIGVLAVLLLVYAVIVFAFQYAVLTRQMLHDEIQDVVTVEGLLYFDSAGKLQLRQDYFSRPQSHLLVDRYMEVRDPQDHVLYRSGTLHGMPLGGPLRRDEGDRGFDDRLVRLADGTHAFVVSHVHGLNGQTLIIRLGYSIAELRRRMLQFLLLLMVAVPAALLVAATAGQTIARKALLPIDEMATRAEGISAHNLHDRLEIVDTGDELGRMAVAFNRLLERLEQSFEQLRRFTSDAAHELRTPLASMRTIGEVALTEESSPEQVRDALADMLDESHSLSQTIDSLLLLARAETASGNEFAGPVQVRELMQEVLSLLSPVMDDSGVTVREVDHGGGATAVVFADRALLRTAFLNVLHNAAKFSPPEGVITIEYRVDTSDQRIAIAIQDEGPGIGVEERDAVLQRFYKGRQQPVSGNTGNGLGLSIAALILERCGGSIAFRDSEGAGARCVLTLPLQD